MKRRCLNFSILMKYSLIGWLIVVVYLMGCSEDDVQSDSNVFLITGTPSTTAKQDISYTFSPSVDVADVTFSLSNQPEGFSIDSKTGVISGVPLEFGTFSNVTLKAISGSREGQLVFDLTVTGDPLKEYAWHLENTGQTSFSKNAGTEGEDLNVIPVYGKEIFGKDILVGVSDSGLEIAHEDLSANSVLEHSKNYNFSPNELGQDPTNTVDVDGDHGTSVGGIIGAVGWNDLGSRGVAPQVGLAGINFLGKDDEGTLLQTKVPESYVDQATGTAYDIFNQSWGIGGVDLLMGFEKVANEYWDTVYHGVANGRNGKGTVFVRAIGNDYNVYKNNLKLSSYASIDANTYEDDVIPYTIEVGALNAKGLKSSYSKIGSNIWVSAPGGEYGVDDPAIVTPDQSGCEKGYACEMNDGRFNAFEHGHELNPECHYTSIFNGTSSAAPNVTGVVALVLQANPNLTWRDVKHILAVTADRVDPNDEGSSLYSSELERGWTQNAAGFYFHNWYGFGRVNADKAVSEALSYDSGLGELKQTLAHSTSDYCNNFEFCSEDTWNHDSGTLDVDIPAHPESVTNTISVGVHYVIEAVQIRLSATHANPGDVGVELTSPSGTKSLILHPNVWINVDNIDNQKLLTNAFYGEDSFGDWEIKLFDRVPNTPADITGKFTNWKINILGHTAP